MDRKEIAKGKRLVRDQLKNFTGPCYRVGDRFVGITLTRWLVDHAEELVDAAAKQEQPRSTSNG